MAMKKAKTAAGAAAGVKDYALLIQPVITEKASALGGGGKTGVNASFPIEGSGPVTMARLSVGPRGLRLFFVGGQAVAPKANLAGNTWAVQFHVPVRRLLDTLIRQGMEHHTALVHADLRDDLRSLARWIDLETLDVDAGVPVSPS